MCVQDKKTRPRRPLKADLQDAPSSPSAVIEKVITHSLLCLSESVN